MVHQYYELPLNFKTLMQPLNLQEAPDEDEVPKGGKANVRRKREMATCDLKKSIAQNIYLIITSKYKENRFDETYGCELWDMDFELVSNENMWLERIRKSIYVSVVKHETRLYDVSVEIDITMDEKVASLKSTISVKKRLSIFLNAFISQTGEPFPFSTNIYLSPLSLD